MSVLQKVFDFNEHLFSLSFPWCGGLAECMEEDWNWARLDVRLLFSVQVWEGLKRLFKMACETDSETYLSLLDDNHWMMVKTVDPEVFLDYMRQHSVLSEEDCQTIQNYFVYQSRRARMRKSSHTTAFL